MRRLKNLKRLAALGLSIALTFTDLISVCADVKQDKESAFILGSDITKEQLKAALEQDSELYPDGGFEFFVSQIDGREGGERQQLVIVRRGGNDSEATVDFKAVDVSASYGNDYLLTVEESKNVSKTLDGSGTPLSDFNQNEMEVIEERPSEEGVTEQPESSVQADKVSDKTSLQSARDAYLRTDSSNLDWQQLDKAQEAEQAAEKEKYNNEYNQFAEDVEGTDYTFTFKKGEYMKSVYIDIIDDDISETDEQVMFLLSNVSNGELAGTATAYLNISDNDENEKAVFAMDTDNMQVDRSEGKAVIVVNRVSGVNKIASVVVGTGGMDAVSGADYEAVQKEVIFAQGVTSQTVEIPLMNYEGAPAKAKFQVALDANKSFVQENRAITTVTLTNEKGIMPMDSEPQAEDDITADAASEWKDTRNVNASANVWNKSWGWSGRKSFINGLDLSTASYVQITWKSDEGSTQKQVTVGSGCKEHKESRTYNNRHTYFYINDKTVITKYQAFGETTDTYNLKDDDKVTNAELKFEVRTADENVNAVARVSKIVIGYPGYQFTVTNTPYSDAATGYSNQYTEKIFTDEEGAVLKQDGHNYKYGDNTILLGTAQVSKNGGAYSDSVVLHRSTDKITFKNTFSSNKTSNGVQVKEGYSGNVYLAGYQLARPNSTEWSSLIQPENIKLTKEFVNTNKKYLYNGNEFRIRPVYRPYDVRVCFQNSDTKKGLFSNGFNGENNILRCTTLDTIKVTGIAEKGYSVAGFSLGVHADGYVHESGQSLNSLASRANAYYNQSKDTIKSEVKRVSSPDYTKVNVTTAKKDEAIGNVITFTPTGEFTYISPVYSTPEITVKIDPLNNDKEKGAIIYSESDSPDNVNEGTVLQGDYNNPLVITGVTLNQDYTLNAITDDGFKAYFKNFTGDVNGDGKISTSEERVVSRYSFVRTASNGNAYTFRPIIDKTLIYYGFIPKTENRYAGYIDGVVMVEEKPVFGGTTTKKAVNGAQVSVAGMTTATKTDDKFGGVESNGGDGYFSISSRDFVAGENQTVNISYNNLFLSATQAVNAAGLYVLDAYDTFGINSADAYIIEGTTPKSINPESISNGDRKYRISVQTYSKNDSLRAKKATFRFYRKDGSVIDSAETDINSDNDTFTLDFNPKSLGITPGASMTVQFFDQNGTGYYEHEMGFIFKESIGVISFLSSFNFGGAEKALEIIGTIDSAFNFGWDGDIDKIAADTEDPSLKTISIGYNFFDKDKFKKEYKKKKQDVKDAAKDAGTSSEQKAKQKQAAKNAIDDKDKSNKSKTKIAGNATIALSFGLEINLVSDDDPEHKGEWYFRDMMLCATANGGVNITISYTTPIGLPIRVGISTGASGAATFIVEQNYDKDKYYISQVMDKDAAKVDIFNFNMKNGDRAFNAYGIFNISPYIDLSAGAGFNFLNLMVGGRADFDMNFYTRSDQKDNGNVTFSAYISLKILFFTKKWEITKKTINMFGESSSIEYMTDDLDYTYESLKNMEADSREYLNNRSEWMGDSDFTAQSVAGTSGVTESMLRQGINPNPDIKMIELSENKYLAVFLDDNSSEDTYNCTHLYYTVYNAGKWSEPALVENDGTTDDAPNIFDLGDKGIYIAWSSADRILTKDDTVISTLNSMNIHGAFFDKNTLKFGDIHEITSTSPYTYKDSDGTVISDNVADVEPHVSYDGDTNRMIMFYTKTEYESTAEDEEGLVGDVAKPYSLIAYRVYDFTSGKWIDTYKEEEAMGEDYTKAWYGQRFLELSPLAVVNESLDENGYWTKEPEIKEYVKATYTGEDGKIYEQDPIVIESASTTYNGLSLFAYVLDYDGNQETEADRDIFMQIYNYSEGRFSHPIMVTTTAGIPESKIDFGRCGDTTLLTYIEDNTLYALNISYIVKNRLLKTDINGRQLYYIDKSLAEGELKEGTHVYMPPVIVAGEKIADTISADTVSSDAEEAIEENVSSIVDYRIASTNNYVYAIWTQRRTKVKEGIEEDSEEALNPANRAAESQLYVARYDTMEGIITDPVQITDEEGANYGSLGFVVNEGETGSVKLLATKAATKLEQMEGDNGEVKDIVTEDTENKSLVELDFTPISTLEIKDVSISEISAGTDSNVSMDLYNDGLQTLTDIKLSVKNESGIEVYSEEIKADEDDTTEDCIFGGRKHHVSFPITLDDDAIGCSLTYAVTDKAGTVLAQGNYSEEIPMQLDITDFNAVTDERGKIKFEVTVMNNGRRKSGEQKITIGRKINEEEDTYKEITSVTTDNILPSESGYYEFTYDYGNYEDMFRTFISKDTESLEAVTYFKASTEGVGEDAISKIEMEASKEQRLRMSAIQKVSLTDGADNVISSDYKMDKGDITQLNTSVESLSYSGSRYDGNDDADYYDKSNTAGLKVTYQSDNEDVLKVYDSGFVEAAGEGTANITAYVMPSNNKVMYSEETGLIVEDNFATLPQEAMILKSFTVTVGSGKVEKEKLSSARVKLSKTVYNWDGKAKKPSVKITNKAGKTLKSGRDYTVTYAGTRKNVGTYKVTIKGKGTYTGTITKSFKITLSKGKTYSTGGFSYKITKNYSGSKAGNVTVIKSSNKKVKNLKIADAVKLGGKKFNVTAIGSGAFKNYKNLSSVKIGSNVVTIGSNAFYGCSKLKTMTITSKKLKNVGTKAIYNVNKKLVIKVPSSKVSAYKKIFNKKKGFKTTMSIKV